MTLRKLFRLSKSDLSPSNPRAPKATQIALPLVGLPGLNVATGFAGRAPLGVQLVAAPFREDVLLAAGAAIARDDAPIMPIDPRGAG